MGLNGLPNNVKKREKSEKQLISASHFFSVQQKLLPHLNVQQKPWVQKTKEKINIGSIKQSWTVGKKTKVGFFKLWN
jgi:hypothetical protein